MSRIRTETSSGGGGSSIGALDDIIRLQLRKPRKWNWELSTSKSSPHIPLPIIQLFDDKKNLLVETKAHDRRSWHVSDYKNARTNYSFPEKQTENLGYRTQVNYLTDSKLKKYPTISSTDSGRHKLNTDEKIRIKEHLLRKSKSDVFSKTKSNIVSGNSFSSRRSNDSCRTPLYTTTPLYEEETCDTFRNRHSKERYAESSITDTYHNNRYTLRSCSAGTLLINEDLEKVKGKRRRRRKTPQLRKNNSSSSDSEKQRKNKEMENISHPVKPSRSIVRRYTDLSSLSDVRKKYETQKSTSIADYQRTKSTLGYKPSDLKYAAVENKLSCQNSDVSKRSEDSITMGANFSRHSSKGLSGRRCQSISNICNSKDHFLDPSGREVDAAYKFCNSLPSPNGTVYNNNYEHKPITKKTSLQHTLSAHVIDPEHHHSNNCHPLQWKFTDTQTCDQGYGSERSPEEEIPPPIPSHDYDCEHVIDFCYSSYPFITPENTFEVELVKGSRGLGLSVCGGVDSDGSWPGLLRIKRLFPHQPAAASGLLSVGDLLLEANGVSLTGLSNYEALEVLRMTPNKVVLLVCRPPPEVLSTMSPVSDIPPPPPRRSCSPQHCSSKMSEDTYEMEFEIILIKIHGSLGFTLCKEEEGLAGHYVRALVREPAISDGRIQPGDKIVAVNGIEISSMSHEQAVQFLRQCDNEVLLRLYRQLDRTPVDLSPTDITPNSSFRPKPNLRQEAVDMLSDLAARKLCPSSPCTSPRHLRNDPGTSHFESLLCTEIDDDDNDDDDDDDDKAVRPCFLDLYNPNQTPVAVRKSKFNLSLAHNAYELNNLDPEMLDAPNLNYECEPNKLVDDNDYPEEPVSMPPLSTNKSGNFSHKKPTYQSAHPQVDLVTTTATSTASVVPAVASSSSMCGECTARKNELEMVAAAAAATAAAGAGEVLSSTSKGEVVTVMSDDDDDENLTKWKGIVFSAERDLLENDAQILNIELNRGWNSRLGFSLQEVDGCTCVSAVYSDSVAAKDGRLKPGDCLLRVNDEMVENMKTCDVIDLLRIIRGPVCITVLRRKFRNN